LSRTNLFTLSTSKDLALGKIDCLMYMYISVVSQLRKIRGVGDYTQLTVHTVLNRTVGRHNQCHLSVKLAQKVEDSP